VGITFICISLVVFLYYTTWALVLPFLDSHHPLQAYFLPRVYVFVIPITLLVLGLTAVVGYLYRIKQVHDHVKKKGS